MTVRHPYKIARQQWLGDALDDLARRGQLIWQWSYDNANSRAIYTIEHVESGRTVRDTREAEDLVARTYGDLGIEWLPVPHPGGERQLHETLQRTTFRPTAKQEDR